MAMTSSNNGLLLDSGSDVSDPTFEPSSSPHPESSTQAQIRQQRRQPQPQARTHPRGTAVHIPQSLNDSPSEQAAESPLHRQTSSDLSLSPSPLLPPTQPNPSTSPLQSQQAQVQYQLRPNTYHGPASTYRNWTSNERTIVQSLQRLRAQDLSIHLFNAYALEARAKAAKAAAGGNQSRSRSRSRSQSQSQSRSRSRPKSMKGGGGGGISRSQSRNRSRVDKGKGRAVTDDHNDDEEDSERQTEELTFAPPRMWTAWPLPPDEVPREQLLPDLASNGAVYRRQARVLRPSVELEECLIAVTARVAKERWEGREWEIDGGSSDEDEVEVVRGNRRKETTSLYQKRRVKIEDRVHDDDVSMRMSDGVEVDSRSESSSDGDEDNDNDNDNDNGYDDNYKVDSKDGPDQGTTHSPSPESDSVSDSSSDSDPDPTIPMFSSQVFHDDNSSSPSSSPSSDTDHHHNHRQRRPVFSADDDRIRLLLTPSTRHVMAQLDELLRALHRVQIPRRLKRDKREKKVLGVGTRGPEEILSVAEVVFGSEVVERARNRCAALFDGV